MRKRLVLGLAAMLLSGCATLEPEPCTSEWVEWKTSQITDDFSREYRSELRDLRRFARKLENPSPLILMEMTGKLETFRLIATDFSEDVIPQLRGAVETCGTPTDFATAFSGFLQEQDMPESVLIWIDGIAAMMGNLSSQGQGKDGGPTE